MRCLVVLLALCAAAFGSASNIYVAQNAAGSSDGSSCANAYPVTFFNTAANWGTGTTQIGPGTIVHLCGTFNGSPGQTLLTFQGSGSSGNPITLKFETNALLSASYWSSQGAIATNGQTWLVIDGGTNGTIRNTLNGTHGASCLGGSCSVQQSSRLVYIGGCSTCNIEVKNLNLVNVYVHTPLVGDTFSNHSTDCIYIGPNRNNVTIDHVLCHDTEDGFDGWGNNITEYNNELYNCNQCVLYGTNVPTSGFVFHDNYIHDPQNWDEVGDYYHHDNLHMFPNSGTANASGVVIYNNWFAGGGSCCNTAHIFLEGAFTSPRVFNNLFDNSGAAPYNHMPGLEVSTKGLTNTNPLVVNNTFLGGDETFSGNFDAGFLSSGITGVTFKNNLVTGGQSLVSLASGSSFAAGGLNNNVYESLTNTGNMFGYNGGTYTSFSAWQSATGQDANAISKPIANLLINPDGTLQSGSPAIGAALNLSGLGITVLNSDKPLIVGVSGSGSSNRRPASGPWDASAYDPSVQVAPPTGLSASVK